MDFAVAAEEVRNLAQRSAQAAQDTTPLIDTSVQKTRLSSERVGKVAESVSGITRVMAEVQQSIKQIRSERGAVERVGQTAQAMQQMERVTQQTAASAEETAASSEQLAQDGEQSRAAVRELARLVDAETERREPAVKVASARPALRRAA